MHPRVNVFNEDVELKVSAAWVRRIVVRILREEAWQFKGSLSIIFVTNEKIRDLNKRFLQSDGFTDVIAFPYGPDDDVKGEVFVSVDQARIQSDAYRVPFQTELGRLIIHGVLHLAGYDDQMEHTKSVMKEKEDMYVRRFVIFE